MLGYRKGASASGALAKALNATRRGKQVAVAKASGSTTLVAGTKTVSVSGATAASFVKFMVVTPGGTMGKHYKVACSAGQFIVTAVDTDGTTVATDTSTLSYVVETPLYHGDATGADYTGSPDAPSSTALTVTAATASSLNTSITLANNIRQVLNQHFADDVAHNAADSTNPVSTAVATNLATVETLLNDCKAAFNAHLTQSGVHITDDAINTVATADASDQSSANALANALKTAINAHLASAPTGHSVAAYGP